MSWTELLDLAAAGMVGAALGHLAAVAHVLDRRRLARHAVAAVAALLADPTPSPPRALHRPPAGDRRTPTRRRQARRPEPVVA